MILRLVVALLLLSPVHASSAELCREVFLAKPQIQYRGKYLSWTPELIIYCIRILDANGLATNAAAIKRGGPEYERVLSKVLGRPNMNKKLLDAKPLPGWNWKMALEQAGVALQVKRIQWTEAMVVEGIQALAKADLPINSVALQSGDPLYNQVLSKALGREVTASKLLQAKPTSDWTWDTALRKSGFNPKNIRLSSPAYSWTEADVSRAIQALHKEGLPINYLAVFEGGRHYERVLENALHAPVTGLMLARANPTPRWNWDLALTKAGFRVNDHKLVIQLSEQDVVRAILLFLEVGLDVHSQAIQNGGPLYEAPLKKALGEQVNPNKVFQAKPHEQWDWNRALIASGLDPNTIRKRGSTPFHLLPEHLQREFAARYEAITGSAVYQRVDQDGRRELQRIEVRTSEDFVREKEIEAKVQERIRAFPERDQYVLTKVLEFFEANTRMDIEAILKFFKENNYDISKEELVHVFGLIRSNKDLLEIINS